MGRQALLLTHAVLGAPPAMVGAWAFLHPFTPMVASVRNGRHAQTRPGTACADHSRVVTMARSAAGGAGLERTDIKKALVGEGMEESLAVRAVEAADKAIVSWETQVTDFCRPPEVAAFERVLSRMSDLKVRSSGGYPQAERARLFFSRAIEYAEDEPLEVDAYLQAIHVEGNFLFDKASHRDFLGAILGTGIVREKVGDILIQGERGAHVIVTSDIADYVINELKSVRSVPVTCDKIALSDLGVRPPMKKELQTVEASMRLDAVASAGMGMSRSKLKDMVESGEVLVNWREVKSPASLLKAGDLVTVRGKGRLEINAVETTSKERYRVKMTKYV